MQLISWLMLELLHQSDERQTDALGLLCDEPGPFSLSRSCFLSLRHVPHTLVPMLSAVTFQLKTYCESYC